MFVYRCTYKPIPGGPNTVFSENGDLHDFLHGFWLNEDFELTKCDDCRYWISPASIHYVEKIKV